MWSLAFINRLRVVCLLASGPKGTSDFKRSRQSRKCARLNKRGEENRRVRDVALSCSILKPDQLREKVWNQPSFPGGNECKAPQRSP